MGRLHQRGGRLRLEQPDERVGPAPEVREPLGLDPQHLGDHHHGQGNRERRYEIEVVAGQLLEELAGERLDTRLALGHPARFIFV